MVTSITAETAKGEIERVCFVLIVCVIEKKRAWRRRRERNGFTDIKDCVPYCGGGASASSSLLHWSPSVLENLRHRPRHPQQQANCQTRLGSFLPNSLSLIPLLFFSFQLPFFLYFRSFPNRHGGSENGGLVSRRVWLRDSC